MRAAHAIASSREGSSRTVKPPLSGGAHEYPPLENVPSAETSTGGTASSIPPAKTQTPAAFASSITACASRPTAPNSLSGTTIAALGKEIRYLAMVLLLEIDGDHAACVRPNAHASLRASLDHTAVLGGYRAFRPRVRFHSAHHS